MGGISFVGGPVGHVLPHKPAAAGLRATTTTARDAPVFTMSRMPCQAYHKACQPHPEPRRETWLHCHTVSTASQCVPSASRAHVKRVNTSATVSTVSRSVSGVLRTVCGCATHCVIRVRKGCQGPCPLWHSPLREPCVQSAP